MESRIRQKAMQLFMTYGPKRISVDELAQQLEISKKSIYKYFTNKNHYDLNAVFEHMITNNIRGVLTPHYRASFEGILQAC